MKPVMLALFTMCLLYASVTDYKSYAVYRFVWWVASLPAAGLLWTEPEKLKAPGKLLLLLFFILLQEAWFRHFYGKADCHAFSWCAVVETACGGTFSTYLMHMSVAFLFLGLIQLGKGNITRKGNLKKPVAFLPYITISFLIVLVLLHCF